MQIDAIRGNLRFSLEFFKFCKIHTNFVIFSKRFVNIQSYFVEEEIEIHLLPKNAQTRIFQ